MYGIGVLFPPLLEVFLWEYTTFTQGDFFFFLKLHGFLSVKFLTSLLI